MATNAILNSGRGARRAPQKGGRRSNDCRRICFFRFFIIFISAAIDSASVSAAGCWLLEHQLSRILYFTFLRCNIIILFFLFSSVPSGLGINIYSAFPCIYILWQQRLCPFNFIIIVIRLAGVPWPCAWRSRAEHFTIGCERYGRKVGCSWNGIPALPLDREKRIRI